MANINIENISELDLNGNDLFGDSESFMTEVNDDNEQESIMGGLGLSETCPTFNCILTDVTHNYF